jgi:methionyl-tRNA synthetase
VHGLGTLAVLLNPVLPKATAKLWTALGATESLDAQSISTAWEFQGGTTVSPLDAPLFPRIETTDA